MADVERLIATGHYWAGEARMIGAGEEAIRLNEVFDDIEREFQAANGIEAQFLEIRRIIAEIKGLPDGEANLGTDKIRELHVALAKVNNYMSDLGTTVHLVPVEIEASALAILTKLVSQFFLRFVSCDECPYHDRCLALVGFEYNDKECAKRLFEWFSHADFPWLYTSCT